MSYYYVAERAVYFSLAIFLITILALLMRYPIVLRRNIIIHSVIFSVYFLCCTFIYELLTALGFRVISLAANSLSVVNLVVLGAWLILLNADGEKRQQQFRPTWMPGREEDLARQLNTLNYTLQTLIS
jgi:hypothetical protein